MTEELRLSRPDVGVVLMRRRVDVAVLAQALRSGMREVVAADDLTRPGRACTGSLRTVLRLGSGSAPAESPRGASRHGLLGQGRRRQDDRLHEPRRRPGVHGQRQGLLVDLDLAFGDVAISLQLLPADTITDVVGDGRPPRRAGRRARW